MLCAFHIQKPACNKTLPYFMHIKKDKIMRNHLGLCFKQPQRAYLTFLWRCITLPPLSLPLDKYLSQSRITMLMRPIVRCQMQRCFGSSQNNHMDHEEQFGNSGDTMGRLRPITTSCCSSSCFCNMVGSMEKAVLFFVLLVETLANRISI